MLARLIRWSAENPFFVVAAAAALAVVGVIALVTIPIDAIPDLSDVQVIVVTDYEGRSPGVIEDLVSYPVATAMLGLPKVQTVRAYSMFNTSMVYVIFEDGTDIYWARSRVSEALSAIRDRLPLGVSPRLGPDATGVGWVYEYALVSDRHDLGWLRTFQDTYLKYELSSVRGVSEVATVGGFVRQYQVVVDPVRMQALRVSPHMIARAIERSTSATGGAVMEMGETEFQVRAQEYITSVSDIEETPVDVTENGTPIRLRDVADVVLGPEMRRGVVELDGRGEVVGGIVVMRFGENAKATIDRVKQRLSELALPEGVKIIPTYDRSGLIERSIGTLSETLVEEFIIVALLCVVFLLHARSAFVSIITLPLAILVAFLVMRAQGLGANIMSLGGIAIAIGEMVDAAIVMVENAHKHIERNPGASRREAIVAAAAEVGPSLFFSLLVITVSFAPVFTLQAQEGRLFRPLAFTKTYAMAAAAILAVTLVPVLMVAFLRGRIRPELENPLNRVIQRAYRPVIRWTLAHRKSVVLGSFVAVAITVLPLSMLGSEFMPPLNEGDILYMPTTPPAISVAKSAQVLQQTDRMIATFPEVERVFGKAGRAETATDPAPMSMIETTIMLKPKLEWRDGVTLDSLLGALDAAVQVPGLVNSWTMPIRTRIDMLSTGIKTPVGVKLLGPNLDSLAALGVQIEALLRDVPGTANVYSERSTAGRYVDIDVDRTAAARYGLAPADVHDVVAMLVGGMNVTETVEGLSRVPINVRYPRELRDDPTELERVLVPTMGGALVPLGQVARVTITDGPPMIRSENGRLSTWLYVDLKPGQDVGRYVARARQAVDAAIKAGRVAVPTGTSIAWSGQYEYMRRSTRHLLLVVPITLVIIFFLLYLNFAHARGPVVLPHFLRWIAVAFILAASGAVVIGAPSIGLLAGVNPLVLQLAGGTAGLVASLLLAAGRMPLRVAETLFVMTALPFAVVGGVWYMLVAGYNVSVASALGFIALAGVAAETGIVVILFIDLAWERRRGEGRESREDLTASVVEGAVDRVRPKLMTVGTTVIGLMPIMWATGTGSELMKRMAAPMIGGMITSTVLTLVVLPAMYSLLHEPTVRKTP